ncbi:uncharacterized protein L969DRAFT_94170 [Mixia osmundae IAM 14324]|uniref:BTB domain-containing protein n=1 Tax=Mixia osmundae (strain CBS 9802 / IAM 14324 / JCM 22182 / KY 12970) TaxID=764103 RepID=G7DWB8_MIXOS|nr:uncharacterized protein L969DRAFT_94170 [Mixia osmundae IAM 14324]KEI40367.1 hypothetical protein L969DRAFT_94170 [Mixia osmundae IAM 14324]GAA94878.1 hypothetical protein E5Q_01533 [Mixia osmundae IAM 14324]
MSAPNSAGAGSSGQSVSLAAQSTLADLTACVRRTKGDIPPPLVGASTTVIGNRMYLFGGRLVPTRVMIDDLYILDLPTLTWKKVLPVSSPPDEQTTKPSKQAIRATRKTQVGDPAADDSDQQSSGDEIDLDEASLAAEQQRQVQAKQDTLPPSPRYFHSAEAYGDKLLIFGGMGYEPDADRTAEPAADEPETGLCVMNDLIVFDTHTQTWSHPTTSTALITPLAEPVRGPSARYAHLSSISNDCLVILGGQDLANTYLQEMNVLDLKRMMWIESRAWDGHCGTYRSVIASRKQGIRFNDPITLATTLSATTSREASVPDLQGRNASRTSVDADDPSRNSFYANDIALHMPYSVPIDADSLEPIYLYSNYNFSNVKRSLELISAPTPGLSESCTVTNLSAAMTGLPSLPPGLRFPTGSVIGQHLVISGTYLSHQMSCFAIWALDLSHVGQSDPASLSWQRIDPGSIMAHGASWNKAVTWKNTMVVLGDRDRDIATDYDHRQTNFNHVALVDLEAFGIYQPPPQILPVLAQEYGLTSLSEPYLCDFEIVCSDGKRVGCSRRILEERWPLFRDKLSQFRKKAGKAYIAATSTAPLAPGDEDGDESDVEIPLETGTGDAALQLNITPRSMALPEPAAVVTALLQYYYTLAICTSLQQALPNLVAMLLFGRQVKDVNLQALVVHALHCHLSQGQGNAAIVYEAATLSGCIALQVRALKAMMNSSRGLGTTRQPGPGVAVPLAQGQAATQRTSDARPPEQSSLPLRSAASGVFPTGRSDLTGSNLASLSTDADLLMGFSANRTTHRPIKEPAKQSISLKQSRLALTGRSSLDLVGRKSFAASSTYSLEGSVSPSYTGRSSRMASMSASSASTAPTEPSSPHSEKAHQIGFTSGYLSQNGSMLGRSSTLIDDDASLVPTITSIASGSLSSNSLSGASSPQAAPLHTNVLFGKGVTGRGGSGKAMKPLEVLVKEKLEYMVVHEQRLRDHGATDDEVSRWRASEMGSKLMRKAEKLERKQAREVSQKQKLQEKMETKQLVKAQKQELKLQHKAELELKKLQLQAAETI